MSLRLLVRLGQMILAICGFFAVLAGCWTVGYYVLPWLLQAVGWSPGAYLRQLLNLILGLLIMYLLMMAIMLLTASKRREVGRPLIDAMERIAKGDFSVRLDVKEKDHGPFRENGPFDDIALGLNNMALELQELEKMRQEFISNVSHEIQSPLTSIKGFARVLRSEELNREERLNYLTIIEEESIRLSKLSDNLLRLASLESEHHPFEPKRFRLDRQLSRLILSCEPQWLEKEIDMSVDLEELFIEADEDLLSQVWINLIHNAIKFTPLGGKIDIRLYAEGDHIVFRIRDTGIGIAEEHHRQIFERFFKADKARSRTGGGSGLGLSLVLKIVELHGGKIEVESKLDQGSQFRVALPWKASQPPKVVPTP